MKIEKLYRILLIRFLFVLTIIFFQFADGQTIENVLTSTNLHFALDNFQEKEIVRLSVPEGITTVEVEIILPLGIEYAEGTAVITKGEAKIIQKAGTLLSQPTFVVTINKSNTITFEFNRKVTSQALLLKGELKDTVKLKVGERLYDTKLSNSYYLRSPSLLLQPSPIVFDKKDGEHNDFFVLSNTGIGGVKDIYFSVDYPEEVSLIDLKYKGEKMLPIGVVPAGYANAGAPLYRVEGTFFNEKKDRIVIYEHYTIANCQANCPIKYATYWGDNTLHFYETKEETKLLHPKEEPTVITLSDDTYTITTTESTTTTATTVGSVFTNDRINGKPIDIQKVIFSLLPQSTSTSFVITKEGNIIVPAQTPIRRYTLNYRICDNSQPSKGKSQKPICKTATVTIAVLQSVTTPTTVTSTTITATTTPTVVTPTVITLSDDTYTLTTTESTTTTATTVGSVFTNDSMNGKPIDIRKVIFSLLPQSTPNTFIITKGGNIIVPSHTQIGRYTLNYRICDNSQPLKNKSQKPVCQTATITIAILQSVTTLTTTTSTTATPTVITLSDDTYTVTTTESTTTTATTVGSVFTNDRMNGKPIDIQKVIFSLLPQSTPNTFVITKDGNIIVPSHTPIGHYILNYRICDSSQPLKNKSQKPVCQTATVTIAVLQSVTTPTIVTPTIITLSDDTYTLTTTESTTTTATTVGSVFANDRLNGKPIDIRKVIFSLLPQSTPNTFIITKDGNIIVPPQTPIGHYTLNYCICDNSQPSKDKNFKPICQTATVTIAILQSVTTPTTATNTTVTATTTPTIVTPTIITLSDDTYTLTTTHSTTTTATTIGSVFTNDRLNGKPIDIQKIIFSLLPQSAPTSFIITKDGNIIIPPQTLIGRYTLNYRICDNSQTSKDNSLKPICQTATVTIVVRQSVTTPTITTNTTVTTTTPTVITLSDDTYTLTTTESTTTTATTVGSVFTNDRLNGKPIDIQKVIFSFLSQSTSISFVITKDGNIIVPAQTPIGRYTLNYRICDNSQPSKGKSQKPICKTATVTIVVRQSVTTPTTTISTTVTATTTPTVITLSDDIYTLTTTKSVTTTATTVGSVFTNDRMNGKPIDIQKVIFSLLPQSTPNTFIITKDGNIIIPAQTPIGCYTLNYRICDNSQPSKGKSQKPICQTATVTIAILQSVTPSATTTLTTVTSTTVTATTTPTIVTPTIITLSDDTYTVTTTKSSTTTATTVGSVFTNDRMNGKPIDIQKVIFSLLPQSAPNTFVITKGGNIIVPAQTPIGRYTLNYRICDNSQTSKGKSQKPICQTATVTIVVLQSVTTPTTVTSTTITATTTPTVVTPTIITLSDDTYTLTTTKSTTTTATTVGSVFANDRLNGKPIDIRNVIFSLLPQSAPNTFIITKDGNIIVPSHTPIGHYILNYRICDNSQPSKDKNQKPICQTATVTIAVLQSVTTPTTATSTTVTATATPTILILSDDTYTLTTTENTTITATTVGSIFTNDRLNGKSIDIQKVIFSLLPQSTPNTFIITKDGNIIVPAQTPIGRYTLNYRICDNSQPSKDKNQKPICQTATVTIAVLQSVTTPTTTTPTTVTSTTTPIVITLSDDTYTVTTTESATTTATIVGSVFSNDRLNGKPIDIQKVIFSLLPQSSSNTFIITKDGNIIIPAQTPIGRYTLNYRICDNSQPSKDKSLKPICKTATVTIAILQLVTTPTTATSTTVTATTTPTVVTPIVITLSDDTYTLTTTESITTAATTVGSVFSNDRLNGKPIDIQKVIFSLLPQSIPTSFVITKDGNIIVPPQTPIGRYTLNYRICDNSQSLKDKNLKPICETATVTIAILQSVTTPTTTTSTTVTATTTPTVITLSEDTYTITTTKSITTTATTVGSVFTNDRMNGKPIDIRKVIFSLLPQSTPNTFIITKDGNVIVPPQTPIGRYTLNYRICDNSQPSKGKSFKPICQTATVTIAVLQSVTTPTTTTNTTVTATTTPTIVTPTIITLSDDTYTLTTTESVTTTATTVGSVFTNDSINGKPIDIQKVIFSLLPQSTPNTFVITKEGNIIVPAQAPIGRYTLNYRICDNSQLSKDNSQKPICQIATITIIVLQSVTTPTTATNTTTNTTVTTTTPTIVTPTIITLSDDTYTITTTESTTTTATTVGSVFTNDRLNGKAIDIQKVIFSLLPQSAPNTFVITKDGNIIVPPQTPIGRYTLNYRICDNSQPSKDNSFKPICQTATVTIAVLQSVTTPSTTITATTTPTTVTPTVISLSDDTYTITTTESVTTTATTVGSVFTNDRINGKPIDIQKVIFSLLPQSTPTSFIITKDGDIILPAQTPIGRYTLNYRICDNSQTSKSKNQKPVCQTATVTIVVLQSVTTPTTATNTTTSTTVTTTTPTIVTPTIITLSDDTYTLTTTESTTTTATTVGSVFANDRLNGKPIDIQKVIFSLLPQSTPTSFVITKDGNIIVPAQTPIGRYTLNYRICDNSQLSKDKNQKPICQTATVTIAVRQSVATPTTTTPTTVTRTTTPTVITLSDDTYTITTTASTTTTATTVGSVFTNDRMNGKPIDIQKVIFSLLPQSTPTSFVITKDGNIIVPPHTPIGRYTLNYRICDSKNKNQKPICQTATITITILQTPVTPTVSATVETDTSSTTQSATNQPIAVSDSATTPMNTPIRIAVLDNDTPYTASPKIVIFPTNGDAFVKEDNTILYRPHVRFIGTDYFIYELCTPSSQSCTTATVTIKVTHRVVPDNAMSANGDDKNDYFHIVGIENYPDNQVTIYNRNGEKVFTISHYDNRQRVFKGIVEGEVSLPNAAHLPQDTYFYLIEYYDENRQLQRQIGWLYLKR